MALDVLRAFAHDTQTARAVLSGLAASMGDPSAREVVGFIEAALSAAEGEQEARAAVERVALLAAAAALRESAPPIADLFVRTRVGERHSGSLGTSAMSAKEAVSVLLRALPD